MINLFKKQLGVLPYSHALHYERVEAWLNARGQRIPDKALFSDLGCVVDGIAVGFLFLTNSRQAYIDHIAADPAAPKAKRDLALKFMLKFLEETAKETGALLVTTLTRNPSMARRLGEVGYTKHEEDFGLFFKVVGGHTCLG